MSSAVLKSVSLGQPRSVIFTLAQSVTSCLRDNPQFVICSHTTVKVNFREHDLVIGFDHLKRISIGIWFRIFGRWNVPPNEFFYQSALANIKRIPSVIIGPPSRDFARGRIQLAGVLNRNNVAIIGLDEPIVGVRSLTIPASDKKRDHDKT